MKTKIKVFSTDSPVVLEKQVNEFLATLGINDQIDIKFSTSHETLYWDGNSGISPSEDKTYYSALIIYS